METSVASALGGNTTRGTLVPVKICIKTYVKTEYFALNKGVLAKYLMYQTQKNQIRGLSTQEFTALQEFCRLSKNMYNVALYNVRQYFFAERKRLTKTSRKSRFRKSQL